MIFRLVLFLDRVIASFGLICGAALFIIIVIHSIASNGAKSNNYFTATESIVIIKTLNPACSNTMIE